MRACPHCLTIYETDPEFCAFDGERTVVFADGQDPLVGCDLDGYRLEAQLGMGGTGCVYRAMHVASNKPCAIKLLFGEMATDRALAERFRRESEAMQRIDHPNVVSVLECATSAAGLTYLAMEFVDGRPLKQVLEEEAPLAPGRVARLAEQLVAGMGEAHRLGYVHRDLKPGNVMVFGPPGSQTAKILDFGIVASLHDRTDDTRLTKTGYIVGTPIYMAPEQIDPSAVTPQVDVYALGVMIYEMLAGKPPFGGTLEQILVAKMTKAPPPIKNGGELGELVLRLLAPDPADRPPTALHVSAELARSSLLSLDPATEKARVPDLAALGAVGFEAATPVIADADDGGDKTRATQGQEDLKTALDSSWNEPAKMVRDPALASLPARSVSPLQGGALRGDSLGAGVTHDLPAPSSPDTVVDAHVLEPGPDAAAPTLLFDNCDTGPATLGPTGPDEPGQSQERTRVDDPGTQGPTVFNFNPGESSDPPEPETDEGEPASAIQIAGRSPSAVSVDDMRLLAFDEGDVDPDLSATRIRPVHSDPRLPLVPVDSVKEPQRLMDPPEEMAATSLELDSHELNAVFEGNEEATADGADSIAGGITSLSGSAFGLATDAGDGDTALDLSLADIPDIEPRRAHPEKTVAAAPPPTEGRGRQWIALLFGVFLLTAAALTYAILVSADTEIIQIAPNSGAPQK